jgi:hypothetical protein
MIRLAWVIAAGLTVSQARAEAEHVVIGPEEVWIEAGSPLEILWIGTSDAGPRQVLTGAGIELVGFVAEPEDAALLGARAMVVSKLGTHSCETLQEPLEYHVVTLSPVLATDGPLTACGALAMSWQAGAILLEEDPMRASSEDGGQSVFWVPGRGFVDRLE